MKYIAFFSVLFGFNLLSLADIETHVQLTQTSAELFFDVQLKNTESHSIEFQLAADFEILDSNLINITREVLGTYKIELQANSLGTVKYKKSIDLTRSYFLYDQDVWHPQLIASQSPRVFNSKLKFTSLLEPGYQLIDSATDIPGVGASNSASDVAYVFGRYFKFQSADDRLRIYLMTQDSALAATLIKNLEIYLNKYETELGPYPYDQFSVVESPDEIGYAFPKMTWIGSQLLRFPFILKTSLPHELLHSWWGNSVFVDYESGNWCEGLTAFGADYALLSEADKKIYRVKSITNYLNYTHLGAELSLAQFISRGEDRSLQALGYDKALMVFVMLEQAVGVDTFKLVLKTFYKNFKYKKASYSDFFEVLKQVSGKDFTEFKKYWIDSTGLITKDFLTIKKNNLDLDILFDPFQLQKIPLMPIQSEIEFTNNTSTILDLSVLPNGAGFVQSHFSLNAVAKTYVIDPDFYLFRELNDEEKPVSFSQFFGADQSFIHISDPSWGEALKLDFPDKTWLDDLNKFDFSQKQNLIISLDQALQNPQIKNKLNEKKISLKDAVVTIETQTFDLKSDSVFLSFKVDQTAVFIIRLNTQLPAQRWLQRWTRYGGQSYVVLSATSAKLQGVWLDKYRQGL